MQILQDQQQRAVAGHSLQQGLQGLQVLRLQCLRVEWVYSLQCFSLQVEPQQVSQIGEVDVLLSPVGGFFTIDAPVATQICEGLKPKVVIPMHFKTAKCDFPIADVEDFLKARGNVSRLDASEVEFKREDLPAATQTVVLKPAL